ncbi:MAG: type II toxin-antitoxin system HicA family toxin [bacterium]|nr:type II toxin-antitoxin system HicA family toxin [bacterium]
MKFPKDIPKNKVIKILNRLGFEIVREGNHIALIRTNFDGSKTPLTMPNHKRIKGSTLRTIINQAGISREEFIKIFEDK